MSAELINFQSKFSILYEYIKADPNKLSFNFKFNLSFANTDIKYLYSGLKIGFVKTSDFLICKTFRGNPVDSNMISLIPMFDSKSKVVP